MLVFVYVFERERELERESDRQRETHTERVAGKSFLEGQASRESQTTQTKETHIIFSQMPGPGLYQLWLSKTYCQGWAQKHCAQYRGALLHLGQEELVRVGFGIFAYSGSVSVSSSPNSSFHGSKSWRSQESSFTPPPAHSVST